MKIPLHLQTSPPPMFGYLYVPGFSGWRRFSRLQGAAILANCGILGAMVRRDLELGWLLLTLDDGCD